VNTVDFLTIANSICPERTCILFEGERYNYEQIYQRCNRLANALMRLGVKKSDKVAFFQVNCPPYLEAYYATAKLGGIFVPINFRAKQDELIYFLNHSEANTLFFGDRYVDIVNAARPYVPEVKNFISLETPQEGVLWYEDLITTSPPEEVFTEIDDNDTTVLMYTAGTTGRPKGVPMNHNAFASYVLQNVDPADPEIAEANLLCVPLYHVAGFQAMLASVYGGRTLIMVRQFDAEEWLNIVQEEKVQRSLLIPTMLKRIIDHPDFARYDLSSLKILTSGAASMPIEVIKKATQLLPKVRFINAIGQTETASTVGMLSPEDHILEGISEEERQKKLRRLASSIGRPLPDVEMSIMDEQGRELPPGEVGEIVIRGPRVMSGYWKDPEKTALTLSSDGWLHTGDMGWRDEEGYFYLAGRGDDMIIRGGENISPEEVEQVLQSHPKIEEAAVIGVPDPEWRQQPRAIVVLKEGEEAGEEEIIEFCRQRLASFKRPRSVIFVDSLPRNPLGKVIRKSLREQYGNP